ncbi:MAG: AAA family ATPase [Candidatus Heimdallarchaeota archaeon]
MSSGKKDAVTGPVPDKKMPEQELVTVADVRRTWQQIRAQMEKVVIGKLDIIEFLWVAMLVSKHVYMEGVPGIAKTWTAGNFATVMGCDFRRIQFTPDMLPADIVGTNIFNPKTGTFNLKKGPIFSNVILADEINRAPPKTQSAMLEAMAEGQVSIEGETHKLIQPFVVLATANPVEQEGTYPLPEAQLDRFLVKLEIGYVSPEDELGIIKLKNNPIAVNPEVVTSPQSILALQQVVKRVYVHDDLLAYMRDVIVATRRDPRLVLGGSPRASISLLESSKARASIHGREYVIPDDIKVMISPAIHHRLILKPEAELEGITQVKVCDDIASELPCPVDEISDAYEEEYEDEEYDDEEYDDDEYE